MGLRSLVWSHRCPFQAKVRHSNRVGCARKARAGCAGTVAGRAEGDKAGPAAGSVAIDRDVDSSSPVAQELF